jgi:hypothetical protein
MRWEPEYGCYWMVVWSWRTKDGEREWHPLGSTVSGSRTLAIDKWAGTYRDRNDWHNCRRRGEVALAKITGVDFELYRRT